MVQLMINKVSRFMVLAVVLLALQTGSAFAQSAEVYDQVTGPWLSSVLDEMKVTYTQGVTPDGNPYFKVKTENFNYNLYLMDNGTSINAYSGFQEKVTAGIMNVWNYAKRFSRAYMDNDNHARLESDFSFKGGASKESVKVFIRTFEASTGDFSKHVQKYTER